MLPILRILPVGGVLLAIFILFLALNPPDGPRAPLNTAMAPARGALVDVGHHPETRQFLIMAALKRADELSRLRDLPDTPTRTAPAEPAAIEPAPVAPAAEESKVAGLPIDRIESDPEPDEPAATETPNVSIPVETGEVSAPELPVAPKETGSAGEKPEQAKELTKEQAKPQQRDTRRRVAHRPRRTRASGQRATTSTQSFRGIVRRTAISQFANPRHSAGRAKSVPSTVPSARLRRAVSARPVPAAGS